MGQQSRQVQGVLQGRPARGHRRQGPRASGDRGRSEEQGRGQRLRADLRRDRQPRPGGEDEVAEAGVAEEVVPVVLGAECDELGSG